MCPAISTYFSCPAKLIAQKRTPRKLYFYFLSHWMGYDCGDSFLFDFEPNGIPSGSKSKGKLSIDIHGSYTFIQVVT